MLRQNGTIVCFAEGVAVIPEAGDRYFDMRKAAETRV
jgi:hypothetical protein